ncbi:Uncharacterized protein Rs2_44397 [Raphanus sativus]|nr:Uncharacterized protein Rs2_46398 [Raphanus sativus]KAJ4873560.1 Uncharacterized protein Rs2_44736 [Raphanus sativus]KAJ4873577.1 Uncharacterized protein Rs2_44713 [Raphanus sativus]KAJ4873859.1 Uncharacterized protein Rs2_44388 [Raphanus sativus]KAJ4873868.1 Uncharacterized protein Rs2_44397 [Raphanus sativus]
MAKEACAEKEDLLMQLLQLEALYLQIKNKKIEKSKEQPPWSNSQAREEGRKRRSKRGKPNGLFGLALGMSLVGAGLFLPDVVRPLLDSLEASKQVKAPPLTHVIAGVTGKKQS